VTSVSEVAQAVDGRDWSGRQKGVCGCEREVSNIPPPLFSCQHTTHGIVKKYAYLSLNHSVKERKTYNA